MKWYVAVLKKYGVFKGRASRKEYWMFVLFNIIFAVVALLLDNLFRITIHGLTYGPIYIVYLLALIVPCLAVSVRRLHDIGKKGAFIFVLLIPIVGEIWYLVLVCTQGNPGSNFYGEQPKDAVVAMPSPTPQ
jgi:uncharacterized membrane protein YhaH (DUF805 family)